MSPYLMTAHKPLYVEEGDQGDTLSDLTLQWSDLFV